VGATAAVGLSCEPDVAAAAARAVSAAVAALGAAPHTVVLFATATYDDPRPVVSAARRAARGAHVVGCATAGVLAGAREVEDTPGVACMAIAGEGLEPFLTATPASVARPDHERGLAVLFADGYSHHPDDLAGVLAAALPGYALAGALASGPQGVYPAHRWLDEEVSAAGTAGLLLPSLSTVVGVTQGCRPLGPVHTVTAARGQVIAGIDGRPAFEVFAERARPLLDDLPRAAQSLFLAVPDGAAVDDRDPLEDGYALRGLLRFDPERGLLAVSEAVPEGTRIRFAVREAHAARADLQRTIADVAQRCEGRTPRLGFYFCCAGRGRGLFGIEDHDVSYIQSKLGEFPLIGFFGGGEIGPGRAGARLHLFSGVLALLP
jgi:small ligand-binding sensory domain FIST